MASSIVISTAKQLGGLLVDEAKYLYEVSDKIERLQDDLWWMHGFLEDADNRQNSEKVVAMWVSTIRDFAYEAEEIIERYVHKVSHPRQKGGWNTIRWLLCTLCDAPALHDVGSNIDDLRFRISELMSRLQLYGVKPTKGERLGSSDATREQRQTYSHTEENPVGLRKHTEKVVEQLMKNDQGNVVGIWGMGGLGKTTLARQVFNDIAAKEHFKRLAWVCISKQFEASVVFKEILKELTNEEIDVSSLTGGGLPKKLCETLNENECLVVLDDIWRNSDWDTLKPAFHSISGSRSKILITTRNSGLTEHIDPFGFTYNPDLLDEDDSWELLQRIAIPKRESADEDMKAKEKLGKEMLEHCKGLPLAIKTLGGVLCNKRGVAEWEIVQKNIASYLMGDMRQGRGTEGLFAMLELSYKDLPYYLKPCFMYLANFPEDYEISAHRLYHLWEAEGLVTTSTDNGDEIEGMRLDDIAESYLNQLVERCLVLVSEHWVNGRIRSCRLHDVIKDMCLKKSKEVNFVTIIKHGSSEKSSRKAVSSSHINRKLRRCALHLEKAKSDDDLPFDPSPNITPSIRSLLVFPDKKFSGPKGLLSPKMSEFFSLLRVLELQRTGIPVHAKTATKFIHLRYLSFKGATFFSSLPSPIWECKYLETLDLRWYTWDDLSVSNKFQKLGRLRHLYLPIAMKLEGSGPLILTDKQLQQLETLKNFNLEVCKWEDLGKMTNMRVFTFDILRYLSRQAMELLLKSPMVATKRLAKPIRLNVERDIINVDTASSLLTAIHNHVCISMLDIKGRIDAKTNLEICHQLNLRKLSLEDSEIGHDGISLLEKLTQLKELTLRETNTPGCACAKLLFHNKGFPQLVRLYFYNLTELEEWEIGEEALPKLKYLRVFGCEKLKMIPDGLPNSVYVKCKNPCISGVEKYNICPYAT